MYEIKAKKWSNILLGGIIIIILNLYNIIKYGINITVPVGQDISNRELEEGILQWNEINIKILISIIISIIIIFNIKHQIYNNTKDNISQSVILIGGTTERKDNTKEYEMLIIIGIIGIITIMISNEIIILYIGLELYTFTIYIIILNNQTENVKLWGIKYLIINTISTSIFLLSLVYLYKETGIWIITINNYTTNINIWIQTGIILSLLFKLGTVPFSYWIIRIYNVLDKRILNYQLIVSKVIYLYILFLFGSLFYNSHTLSSLFTYLSTPLIPINIYGNNNLYFNTNIFIFLILISLLSLLLGSIGGTIQYTFNTLFTYSSILNIGYLLLGISFILLNLPRDLENILFNINILTISEFWTILEYLLIYFFSLIGLFSWFYLYNKSSFIFKWTNITLHPYSFFSLCIFIFSFIGIPPLAGFYAKLHILMNILQSYNIMNLYTLSNISIFVFIISTLISIFLYLKFLTPSSLSYDLNSLSLSSHTNITIDNTLDKPTTTTYILSLSVFFIIFYLLFILLLFPLLSY